MSTNTKCAEPVKPSLNTLPIALSFLKRHPDAYLFPIRRLAKFPPLLEDNLGSGASKDPTVLTKHHDKWPGCNWGIALAKSKMLVVDEDTKPGKSGTATFDELNKRYETHGFLPGFTTTFTVTSPSGGRHLYYRGEHRFALGKHGFGEDVDSPNYALLPGCWIKDDDGILKCYRIEHDGPMTEAPSWFYDVLGANKAEAVEQIPVVDLDQDLLIRWAIHHAKHAPPSIQGKGGNQALYSVAAALKDAGISQHMSVEILSEHFNSRCEPPWSLDPSAPREGQLAVVVANAYTYARQNAPGSDTAEAIFGGDPLEPFTPEQEKEQAEIRQRNASSKPSDQPRYVRETAIVVQPPMFVQLRTGKLMSNASFDKAYGGDADFRKGRPNEKANRSKQIKRFSRVVYRPTAAPEVIEGDELLYNTYRRSNVTRLGGEPKIVLDHLAYLIPDPTSREQLLDWLAWLVQHPDKKMMFAILLVGPGGTGKSWVADLMRLIVGAHNASVPRKKSITRDFNGWMAETILVVIHELKGYTQLIEELKDLITQGTVEINRKNVEAFEIDNYANFFTISNSEEAIPPDGIDRRWLVIRCAEIPRHAKPVPCGEMPYTRTAEQEQYYRDLFTKHLGTKDKPSDEARRFLNYLLARRIKLDCAATAPDTKARSEMVAAGRSALESILTDAYREEDSSMIGRVFSLSSVLERVGRFEIDPRDHNIKAVERVLRQLGCVPIRDVDGERVRRVRVEPGRRGRQISLWARSAPDAAKLARLDNDKLGEIYRGPTDDEEDDLGYFIEDDGLSLTFP